MRRIAPHGTADALMEQPRNHLVGNRNIQSNAVIVEPAEWSEATARSLPERIARLPQRGLPRARCNHVAL
jgi:hypothetical protein